MPILAWNPSLDLGVPDMNHQHQRLLDLMNRLHDESAGGAGHAALTRTLLALKMLVARHFADEERYMEAIGFPGLAAHRRIHQELQQTLQDHADTFLVSGAPTLPLTFFHFLKLWLTAHIQGVDRKYADHAATRAV